MEAAEKERNESMKQQTWPARSSGSAFKSLPIPTTTTAHQTRQHRPHVDSPIRIPKFLSRPSSSSSSTATPGGCDFSALPPDIVARIGASFTLPTLQSSSLVCRAWRDALRPLREAMLYLRWGKKFKHGRGGIRPNLEKALGAFLKGVSRGSALAMVDAGLLYWEIGEKEKAIAMYARAAQLCDPAGQCNLGIAYLQVGPSRPEEAVRWLVEASYAGHVRAQYQLAQCFHQGRGVNRNLQEAAKWYLKSAGGGYVRAMYNLALCYSVGEGLVQNRRLARKWMKRAADRGHGKAQFEFGLGLFSEGEMLKAVVYLELATRAGETAAANVKNVIIQQLPATSHDHAMSLADKWRALSASH